MRPLIIDEAAREQAKRVIAYADAHHYRPGVDPVPGDDPQFVAHLGTYRCVFTYTHADGMVYRHLSVSVPSKKFAHPIAAFHIADLFGFTGYAGKGEFIPDDWVVHVNDAENCVVLAQAIAADVPKERMQ